MSGSIRRVETVPPAHGDPGVQVRQLMRTEAVELKIIEVEPDRSTPFHAHAHAHDAVVVAGSGAVRLADEEHEIGPGHVVTIAPDERHAILGRGPGTLRLVCMDSFTE